MDNYAQIVTQWSQKDARNYPRLFQWTLDRMYGKKKGAT